MHLDSYFLIKKMTSLNFINSDLTGWAIAGVCFCIGWGVNYLVTKKASNIKEIQVDKKASNITEIQTDKNVIDLDTETLSEKTTNILELILNEINKKGLDTEQQNEIYKVINGFLGEIIKIAESTSDGFFPNTTTFLIILKFYCMAFSEVNHFSLFSTNIKFLLKFGPHFFINDISAIKVRLKKALMYKIIKFIKLFK
jgi:hypothetical protein